MISLILMNCIACDSECVANGNYCHICGINLRLPVVSCVLHATFKKEIVDATFVKRLSNNRNSSKLKRLYSNSDGITNSLQVSILTL